MKETGSDVISHASVVNLTELIINPSLCEKRASALQRKIALETVQSRGWLEGTRQYGRYFLSMWLYGLQNPDGAKIIRDGNFCFRLVDDIADGDRPLPISSKTKQEYLQRRKDVLRRLYAGKIYASGEEEDVLVVDWMRRERRLGISLGGEALDILDSIIFDEERARSRRILTQQELYNYFQQLDLACLSGSLKVAGEKCSPQQLADIAMAVRIMFNLRDFPEDYARGVINISREDLDKYDIDLAHCDGKTTVEEVIADPSLRSWYKDQTNLGLRLLQKGREAQKRLGLKIETRTGLWLNFERPVEAVLGRYKRLIDV